MKADRPPLVSLLFVAGLLVTHPLLLSAPRAATAPLEVDSTVHRDGTLAVNNEARSSAEPSSQADKSTGVAGKVVSNRKPVAGLRVHAYTDAAGAFRGEGFAASAPTTADGAFSLHLPPGTYFLVAKGYVPPSSTAETGGDTYFGYYGGNPVRVNPGLLRTSIIHAAPSRAPVVAPNDDRDKTNVKGVVLGPGGAVEGAAVHVYTDAAQQFRGPDIFGPQGAVSDGTDAKGSFTIELPAGTYYLVASKRKGGAMLGHLQQGDLYGYYDGNPLQIAPGTSTAITIQIGEKVRDTPASAIAATGNTGIRGTIRDPSGNVPAGVYAFVVTDPSPMIGAMPPYRSQYLGQDGSFTIELPAGQTYYVFARSGYGGPPLAGEWNGFYGDKDPRPVVVPTGTLVEGIDFVVKKTQ